jgi:hypothetical protein
MEQNLLGNMAEWVAAIIALLALVLTIRQGFQLAKRREEFDRRLKQQELDHAIRQQAQDDATKRTLEQLRAELQGQLDARANLMLDLGKLREKLGHTFEMFRDLLQTAESDTSPRLVAQTRAAITALVECTEAAGRLSLAIKPRHRQELERLETALIEMLLDISRSSEYRKKAVYRAELERSRAVLQAWEVRTRWIMTTLLGGRPVKSVSRSNGHRVGRWPPQSGR